MRILFFMQCIKQVNTTMSPLSANTCLLRQEKAQWVVCSTLSLINIRPFVSQAKPQWAEFISVQLFMQTKQNSSIPIVCQWDINWLLHNRKVSSSYTNERRCTINIQKKKKIINHYHKSTLTFQYNVQCSNLWMATSNIKPVTTTQTGTVLVTTPETRNSTVIFLVCFSCTVCIGLGSSSCGEGGILPSDSWQGGSFQCEFVAASCGGAACSVMISRNH